MNSKKVKLTSTEIKQNKLLMANDLNETIFGVHSLRLCIVGDSGIGKSTMLKVLKSAALITDLPAGAIDKFWINLPTSKPDKIDCHMLICDTDGEYI